MKKQWMLCYVGCSGSGKSTSAKKLKKLLPSVVELNRDEWRFNLFTDGLEDWSKYKFTKEREQRVTEKLKELFDEAVAQGRPIIVSNTNLNKKDQEYWRTLAEEVEYDFSIQYFDETLDNLLKRDSKRGALAVGREVLLQQWQKWLDITNARRYIPNTSLPKTVVCDIDGTVAKMVGRSPYDWSRVGEDEPRVEIIKLVEGYTNSFADELVFVSGRDGSCYDLTYEWLSKHVWRPFKLYMRAAGDMRKDSIVKEEIIFDQLEPRYNIVMWFDDRQAVVEKLMDLKIPNVINVAETYVRY